MFPDLLSIDAWHLEFNDDRNKVDFHAVVVFDQARLGGEGDVSFTLKIKKARLIVGLPPGFEAPSDSIFQIAPKQGLYKRTDSKNSKSGFTFTGLVNKNKPSFDVNAQTGATHERAESIESVAESNLIEAKSGFVPGEKVWWDFTSIDGMPLDGPVWRSDETILMTVKDSRKDEERLPEIQNELMPPIEVRVVCRREDLDICIYGSRITKLNQKNIASAESYIRDVLSAKGLEYESDMAMKLPTASIELVSGFARTNTDE